MKSQGIVSTIRALGLASVAALLAAGCVSRTQHSFNQDYNQYLASAPTYAIENINDNSFKVVVDQGSPTTSGPQRIVEMKGAVSAVAATEAKRRGWQNWDMNFITDRDQGWMHIYIAVVTKKNPVELNGTPAPAGGN